MTFFTLVQFISVKSFFLVKAYVRNAIKDPKIKNTHIARKIFPDLAQQFDLLLIVVQQHHKVISIKMRGKCEYEEIPNAFSLGLL